MMKWLLVLVMACAPTTRIVSKRCPVPLSAVLFDLTLGTAAMVISAFKYETGHEAASYLWTAGGGAVMLGAYGSELTCTRKN